jgi:Terminase RNaseH-like domain
MVWAAIDKFRFVYLCAGRRFGKTFLLKVVLTKCAQASGLNIWYVAPTYRMAKRLMWEQLKRQIPRELIKKKDETALTITFVNDSMISLFGADNPDRLVGDGIDICVIDEADLIKKLDLLYKQSIRPALADKLGKLLMASTPRGLKYFWELCSGCFNFPDRFPRSINAKISNNSYFLGFTTAEGGNVPLEELIEAEALMGARLYRQEFLASFEAPGNLVYEDFSIANIDKCEYDPGIELHIGMDFNVSPMTAAIGQAHEDGLEIFDEVSIDNGNTKLMATEIRRRYPNASITVYPDPAGKARGTSADIGVTDHSILAGFGFKVVAPSRAPSVIDRVNTLQALICSADDKRRLIVDPKCRNLLNSLQSQQYVDGTKIPDKSTGFDHFNDAIGYMVWMRFNLLTGRLNQSISEQNYR